MASDRAKTLDELEGHTWGDPDGDSYLVSTCHRLRSKPIGLFSAEDLRIMLGQHISVALLLPVALEVLEADPLAEGDFYPGDLLKATMSAPVVWESEPVLKRRMRRVLERALLELGTRSSCTPGTDQFIPYSLVADLAPLIRNWLSAIPADPAPA
jgi:hypothetical protein